MPPLRKMPSFIPPPDLQERMRIADEVFGMASEKWGEEMKRNRMRATQEYYDRVQSKKAQQDADKEAKRKIDEEAAKELTSAAKKMKPAKEAETTRTRRDNIAESSDDPLARDPEPSPRKAPWSRSGNLGAAAGAVRTQGAGVLHVTDGESTTRIVVPAWAKSKTGRKSALQKRCIKEKAPIIKALDNLKDCIRRCENERNPERLDAFFNELRDHVHKAEFLEVNEFVLIHKHMLDNGLGRIFAPTTDVDFPWDLRADALQLFQRWAEKNFSIELLRGIRKSKSKDFNRSADRIDADWRKKFLHQANYYGQGDLVLGQWWPTQLCTVRDGAHGSVQGGIYGEKSKGAYSIVISGSDYADQDHGETIFYSGTISKDRTPTENTQHMMESCDTVKQPVRVLRSHNANESDNPYRPEFGFRYDGLYDVVSYEKLDDAKAMYRFRLMRCAGQRPIRCEEGPSRRPTIYEVEAYKKEVMEKTWEMSARK